MSETTYDDPDYLRLHDALRIDLEELDECLIQQPSLYQEVAEGHALKISERDQAHEACKVTDADLSLDLRKELEEETGKKPTEAQLSSEIQIHEDHAKAHTAYLTLKREADYWHSLREAYHQRAYILRDLAQLMIAGYSASDAVSGGAGDVKEKRAGSVRQKVAAKKRSATTSKSK